MLVHPFIHCHVQLVQEFYNLNIYDVINGTLKNEDSGIWYQSEKKLTLPEILVIAKV